MGLRGRVWIAWLSDDEDDPAQGSYWCSWQGDDSILETGPDVPDLAEALEWGRMRAAEVLVRPQWDAGQYYWAGAGPVPGSDWIAGRLTL